MRTCETKKSVFNKFSNTEHPISETAYDRVAYGGVRCLNTGFIEHPSNTLHSPVVHVDGYVVNVASTSAYSYFSFQENFDHTTTPAT